MALQPTGTAAARRYPHGSTSSPQPRLHGIVCVILSHHAVHLAYQVPHCGVCRCFGGGCAAQLLASLYAAALPSYTWHAKLTMSVLGLHPSPSGSCSMQLLRLHAVHAQQLRSWCDGMCMCRLLRIRDVSKAQAATRVCIRVCRLLCAVVLTLLTTDVWPGPGVLVVVCA